MINFNKYNKNSKYVNMFNTVLFLTAILEYEY